MDRQTTFEQRYARLFKAHEALLGRKNVPEEELAGVDNGIYNRWQHPILTREHAPLHWRYDLNPQTNPRLMERIGINSAFNAGAMLWQGCYVLVVRVEGHDRKSFLALAESPNGVDNFRFHHRPLTMPETDDPDTNVYDMRLTRHEDGYIYGLFCTERKDLSRPQDLTAAMAACGIARTTDLVSWERLPDLVSKSGQQRNVVLHPEFVQGQYALYTRPQEGFISVGSGGGICWALTSSMEGARISEEIPVEPRHYHTITEFKNGQGPPPLKTPQGWLHLAHGARNTAAGLRYVLYLFMTDLDEPWRVTHKPGGHFLSPLRSERVGDVSNVVFSNGWIRNDQDQVFIYYASSDTRMHVATSSIDQLLDYCMHTPPDGLRSAASVETINRLVDANEKLKPLR